MDEIFPFSLIYNQMVQLQLKGTKKSRTLLKLFQIQIG